MGSGDPPILIIEACTENLMPHTQVAQKGRHQNSQARVAESGSFLQSSLKIIHQFTLELIRGESNGLC